MRFSAVYRVGGSKSLQFFTPETGGGSRAKNRSFKLKKNIETVLSADLDESTADIDKRLEELQTELIQKANSKESYDNIVNEIYRLRDLRQETLSRNALRQDKRDRIAEMTDFLNTQTGDITEFDDKLVRKLVEKAIAYDDRLMVEFKLGLEIEVNL